MTWQMDLEDVINATQGRVLQKKETKFSGVGTDTRKDLCGQLFFALKGDQFDAHAFVGQAFSKGAAAAVIHGPIEGALSECGTIIEVSDTLEALKSLAQYWRRKWGGRVFAITGTSGKTTTKEFASVLLKESYRTHWSHGSFNNHWGVPLTLLGIDREDEVAIVEMGMNHPGEISELVRIAEPNVALVTMVGRGHLEGLTTIEAVAKAKEEIYEGLKERDLQIFNLDNSHTRRMWERRRGKLSTRTFSSSKISNADVSLRVIARSIEGFRVKGEIGGVSGEVALSFFGSHHVHNLMAASAIALTAGVLPGDIWKRLSQCQLTWGRGQILRDRPGITILFDGYNANPESMEALFAEVAAISRVGRRIFILADMLELGAASREMHFELGARIVEAQPELVWFYGSQREAISEGLKASGYKGELLLSSDFSPEIAQKISLGLERDDFVALKGSRGMKIERALPILLKNAECRGN